MPKDFNRTNGCASPQSGGKHGSTLFVELITTAALALSTAVAVTAVSIGMARADVLGSVAKGDSAPLAIAIFIGLLFTGMGGLTALMARDR
jgi:glycerol uptake facilitator-like aquaporin